MRNYLEHIPEWDRSRCGKFRRGFPPAGMRAAIIAKRHKSTAGMRAAIIVKRLKSAAGMRAAIYRQAP